jgi:hypothetical protein
VSDVDDLAGALHEVVAAAALLLAADGAGVMLADQTHALRWVTATGEAEQTFDRAQRDLGEGSCIDAFLLDQVVWTEDLRVDPRWPRLGPAGPNNQIRGVLSAPLSLAGQVHADARGVRTEAGRLAKSPGRDEAGPDASIAA